MIWDRVASRLIRAVGYDATIKTMAVKFTDGSTRYHPQVPFSAYQAVVHSRFPEKTYRHYLQEHVLV